MINAWWDARAPLEKHCWVAQHVSPLLLAYYLSISVQEVEANPRKAIDRAAPMLYFLMQRPLWPEMVNVGNL